jgi:citrate synthase
MYIIEKNGQTLVFENILTLLIIHAEHGGGNISSHTNR